MNSTQLFGREMPASTLLPKRSRGAGVAAVTVIFDLVGLAEWSFTQSFRAVASTKLESRPGLLVRPVKHGITGAKGFEARNLFLSHRRFNGFSASDIPK